MEYSFHDKIVLRTPLKSVKTAFTEAEIRVLFEQQEVREALFLASPDLCNEYDRWVAGEVSDRAKQDKLIAALHKYASRMHTRCTPFGLFASCSVVNWGEGENQIVLEDKNLYRSTRLDMHFSCQIAQQLAEAPYLKPHLLFFPSTSAYTINDKLRYIEYNYENKHRVYQISAVDSSVYIECVLAKAVQGARIQELAEALPEMDAELSLEDSLAFVNQLVAEQLLISEVEPSVSGDELLEQILVVLARIENEVPGNEELKKTRGFLLEIRDDLKQIDAAVFNDINAYHNLATKLESTEIPYELSKLFQTDLFRRNQPENRMDESLKGKIKKTLRILNRMNSYTPNGNLKNFQEKFYERYEEAEIPLLTVLDNESGIGYAQNTNHTGDFSPLVNDLMVFGGGAAENQQFDWSKTDSFLHKKLVDATKEGLYTVSLQESDFKDFDESWDDLPDSLSVMFSHTGDKVILNSIGGSSAINLFGRFASGSHEIKEIIEDIAKAEEELNPDVILAEIVHLPETRTGNILMRPSFRSYEIPYLSKSDLPKENQLGVDDLYISVVNQKLVLRSKKHGKRVFPRLGNAHNYSFRSLPVYHFLCDLQTYDRRGGLYFHWGSLQSEFKFLPRVEVEDVIISVATWNFNKKDVELLTGDDATAIEKWQAEHKLPDLILFCEGDNELLINLKSELSRALFLSTIKGKGGMTIKEFLFDPELAVVKNDAGEGYTNQFVATLVKDQKGSDLRRINRRDLEVQRNFAVGSEWLFYKLYGGTKTADELIAEVINPLVDSWLAKKYIDQWFFIRYSDPDTHLRVRFHFSDFSNMGRVITEFNEALQHYIDSGLLWKVQLDTYRRELERYGFEAISIAEEIFYHDSQNIADVLSMIEYDLAGEKIRWLYALRAVDQFLIDFDRTLEQRRDIMENLRNGFGREFGMNKHLNKQIDKKFRADKESIDLVMDRSRDESNEMLPLFELLDQKTANIKPLIDQLLQLDRENRLGVHVHDLIGSYIHMLLNRLFKNKQRLHELVIYDFLWKRYRSDWARANKGK